jgi:hypothetical protein
MKRLRQILTGAVAMVLTGTAVGPAVAFTTSQGQDWRFEPDAWTRGNDADTSHFGWDDISNPAAALLPTQPFPTGARILDDTTPDLDPSTTASGLRFYQGADGMNDPIPTSYGHVSTSGNYYSGFNESDFADDTISGTAPASAIGGYTTVVLQLIGSATVNPGLTFEIDDSSIAWTLDKSLFGLNGSGSGMYWLEWWAPGDDLTFSIHFSSDYPSVALDAVQIDTHWSATGPVLNGIQRVPEPASVVLVLWGAAGGLARLVRQNRGVAPCAGGAE